MKVTYKNYTAKPSQKQQLDSWTNDKQILKYVLETDTPTETLSQYIENFCKECKLTEQKTALLFCSGDKILGVILTTSFYNHHTKEQLLFINNLFVNPQERHKGLGTKILKAIEQYPDIVSDKKFDSIMAYAKSDNEVSAKLFEKSGYYVSKDDNNIVAYKQLAKEDQNARQL